MFDLVDDYPTIFNKVDMKDFSDETFKNYFKSLVLANIKKYYFQVKHMYICDACETADPLQP